MIQGAVIGLAVFAGFLILVFAYRTRRATRVSEDRNLTSVHFHHDPHVDAARVLARKLETPRFLTCARALGISPREDKAHLLVEGLRVGRAYRSRRTIVHAILVRSTFGCQDFEAWIEPRDLEPLNAAAREWLK